MSVEVHEQMIKRFEALSSSTRVKILQLCIEKRQHIGADRSKCFSPSQET